MIMTIGDGESGKAVQIDEDDDLLPVSTVSTMNIEKLKSKCIPYRCIYPILFSEIL